MLATVYDEIGRVKQDSVFFSTVQEKERVQTFKVAEAPKSASLIIPGSVSKIFAPLISLVRFEGPLIFHLIFRKIFMRG